MTALAEAARRAFAETSDPEAYVARDATERALASIREWGESDDEGSTLAAVVGTPGLGKTQLLRVTEKRINDGVARFLAEGGTMVGRVPDARAIYLPYAALSLSDLASWVHGLLGLSYVLPPGLDEESIALEALGRLGGGAYDPFFLIFDDADAMPTALIRSLLAGLPRVESPLRILLSLNPDSKATRLLSALHALAPTEITFRARMSVEETGHYLRTRMQQAAFPAAEIAQLSDGEIARLHGLSSGIPRRLHDLLLARFEEREVVPLELDGFDELAGDEWLGRPFDED